MVNVICLLFCIFRKKLKVQWSGTFLHWATLVKILRVGVPNGIVTFVDVFAISAIALLILPLGDIVINSHQIMLGLMGLMFMVPLSMGSAFSILVSTKIGAEHIESAWQLSKKAVAVVVLVGLCLASFVWIFQRWIIALFSGDQQVLAVAFSLMMLVCWMHIFDAVLVITFNILRCWKEVVLPMFIFTGAVLVLGLGGGWYIAYHPISFMNIGFNALGIYGFWWMLAIAYTVAACLCLLCLGLKYRHYIRST